MDRKLAGLAFLFKLQGGVDFTRDLCVRQALKGYRRTQKRRDSRRPVSFDNLRSLFVQLGLVCTSAYEVYLFRAAFSLPFFGAFQISELVSPSKRVPGGLRAQDVTCKGVCMEVLLRRSKMDQGGKGV